MNGHHPPHPRWNVMTRICVQELTKTTENHREQSPLRALRRGVKGPSAENVPCPERVSWVFTCAKNRRAVGLASVHLTVRCQTSIKRFKKKKKSTGRVGFGTRALEPKRDSITK